MTPERWQEVKQALDTVMLLAASDRAKFLIGIRERDPVLHDELESLILSHQQAGTAFLRLGAADETFSAAPVRVGSRIGAYHIVAEIGRGGMGQVYRAIRADGQYEKEVAVKLVRRGFDTPSLLQRFRNERQILADLDHPNIARLLDGGATEEGTPYLVMELIDGSPIDEYCDHARLGIRDRLMLFRQVCGAVQFAHQSLVIHRDIKPSNILVTRDGTPKLLDFGIAKILDVSGVAEATAAAPLTPEFASPEQVRGEAITTAADIYSLGVVLYKILSGDSPYAGFTHTPLELSHAICEWEPPSPSARVERPGRSGSLPETHGGSPVKIRRQLIGDLDHIVMKALRKEPSRRYGSAEQLSEDLRRYLDGLAVHARKGSWQYRAGKFVKRHRVGVAAVSLVLLAMVAGVAATVREARVATRQKELAEKRFNDVRRLANSLMFEVHDSIQGLPGSTPARKLLVQRSLEYLDSLTRESADDVSLQRELASAYEKVGAVEGTVNNPNLGDAPAALASFQRAAAMREAIVRAEPQSVRDRLALAAAYDRVGQLLWFSFSDTGHALEFTRKAVSAAETAAGRDHQSPAVLQELAAAYEHLGDTLEGNGMRGSASDFRGGLEAHQKALGFYRELSNRAPEDINAQERWASAELGVGDDLVKVSRRLEALEHYDAARKLLEPLPARTIDTRIRHSLIACYTRIADALLMSGKTAEALRYYQQEWQLLKPMAAADPSDVFSRSYVITAEGDVGHALVESGSVGRGLGHLLRSLRQEEDLVKADNDSHNNSVLASAEVLTGEALERSGRYDAALRLYSRALNFYSTMVAGDSLDAEDAVNTAFTRSHIGRVCLRLNNVARADSEYHDAQRALEKLLAATPDNVEALYALADVYAGLGDVAAARVRKAHRSDQVRLWREAGSWYRNSLDTWRKIPNPAHISPNFFNVIAPSQVARREAIAEANSSTFER